MKYRVVYNEFFETAKPPRGGQCSVMIEAASDEEGMRKARELIASKQSEWQERAYGDNDIATVTLQSVERIDREEVSTSLILS